MKTIAKVLLLTLTLMLAACATTKSADPATSCKQAWQDYDQAQAKLNAMDDSQSDLKASLQNSMDLAKKKLTDSCGPEAP